MPLPIGDDGSERAIDSAGPSRELNRIVRESAPSFPSFLRPL
jgi:hypothetical protein